MSDLFESRNSVNNTSQGIAISPYERIVEVRVEVLDDINLLGLQMLDE